MCKHRNENGFLEPAQILKMKYQSGSETYKVKLEDATMLDDMIASFDSLLCAIGFPEEVIRQTIAEFYVLKQRP